MLRSPRQLARHATTALAWSRSQLDDLAAPWYTRLACERTTGPRTLINGQPDAIRARHDVCECGMKIA